MLPPSLGRHQAEGAHVLQTSEWVGNCVNVLGLVADKDGFGVISLLERLEVEF